MAQINGLLQRFANAARGAVQGGLAGYVRPLGGIEAKARDTFVASKNATGPHTPSQSIAAGLRAPSRPTAQSAANDTPGGPPPLQFATLGEAKREVQTLVQTLAQYKDGSGPPPDGKMIRDALSAVINTPGLTASARHCLADIRALPVSDGHWASARVELSAALKLFD